MENLAIGLGDVEWLFPREADEEDWNSSDDAPLTSVANSTSHLSKNHPLRWDRLED